MFHRAREDTFHCDAVTVHIVDGTKLIPMVIFKRKTKQKIMFLPGIYVYLQENGWMDENGVNLWMQNVWWKRPNGLCSKSWLVIENGVNLWMQNVWWKRPNGLCSKSWLVIREMFRSDTTKSILNEHKTITAVMPAGLTSILQPLVVCLNTPLTSTEAVVRLFIRWNFQCNGWHARWYIM
ncbi:DDE superfamily endonuclease [Popillia japonica]|uniref:DDE superfamily endonuclease n=1 Tax=Popillia japonica TaxID=7064 RepID=A0AAW1LUI3_POPJA